jgi:hypothetical protein
MLKHVSSNTYVDQTAWTKHRPQWCLTFEHDDFTFFGKNNLVWAVAGIYGE